MSDPNLKPYGGKEALLTYESPHDTFDAKNHRNWLLHEAGLGVYAHGRIHQEQCGLIHVGDMVHKRGHRTTEDVLLMEEQALDSMGEPLSVPTRLGDLMAIAILPTMNTANGEGDLIAYYERGVVAFNTHESPRESRFDGEGKMVQRGWDFKRLVNHLLNAVGCVGRYAVVTLTRDHFFRSTYGLHFLKVILGEGTFNSENTNRISQDIDPLLARDRNLSVAATGFWIGGNRMFATTGLMENGGKGFVVFNQAITYTEDRTPIPAWEGLWLPSTGTIHKFVENGFILGVDDRIELAVLRKSLQSDRRKGKDVPIRWQMTTGQFAPLGLDKRGAISDGVLEVVVSDKSQDIQVYLRTDQAPEWRLWTNIKACQKEGQKLRIQKSLGKPPAIYRECTWFQVRIQGTGYAEGFEADVNFSPTTGKSGRNSCTVVTSEEEDYFNLYEYELS